VAYTKPEVVLPAWVVKFFAPEAWQRLNPVPSLNATLELLFERLKFFFNRLHVLEKRVENLEPKEEDEEGE